MDLKEEALLGDQAARHWYYRAKSEALLAAIDGLAARRVLDVGAGSGFFSRQLLDRTGIQSAVCVDPNYPEDTDQQVAGKPLAMRRSIAGSDADLVLMMDVIEHVDDDRGLVAHYVDLVPAGTVFVITVPAFMWLWSGHDVFLEHRRRYTLGQLRAVIGRAGLRVVQGHYFFGAILPAVAMLRGFNRITGKPPGSDMRREGPVVNEVLYRLSAAETRVMRLNHLGGTSIFALAVKD